MWFRTNCFWLNLHMIKWYAVTYNSWQGCTSVLFRCKCLYSCVFRIICDVAAVSLFFLNSVHCKLKVVLVKLCIPKSKPFDSVWQFSVLGPFACCVAQFYKWDRDRKFPASNWLQLQTDGQSAGFFLQLWIRRSPFSLGFSYTPPAPYLPHLVMDFHEKCLVL